MNWRESNEAQYSRLGITWAERVPNDETNEAIGKHENLINISNVFLTRVPE